MKFKLEPPEVPKDDPFRNDSLDRKPSAEALTNLVANLSGPFVLALDSPWGTGKTTFLRMWRAYLEAHDYACLYLNAWETDFSTDPLAALLGELNALAKTTDAIKKGFRQPFDRAKRIASVLGKRVLPVAARLGTAGLLDLSEFTEKVMADLAADSVKDAIDAYAAEKDLGEKFRESLTNALKAFQQAGKKEQVIIFVDDLDRCRPTFAIELLERVKHFLNIPNALFVIAIDKGQLGVSLKAIYGAGLNVDEYLRRFLALEFVLPPPNTETFTSALAQRFEVDAFFRGRTHPELRDEKGQMEKTFNGLVRLFSLNLHAREQCFSRMRVAMLMTPTDHYLYPVLLAALVVFRAASKDAYVRYALQGGSAKELVDVIRAIPDGNEFLMEHPGTVLEAHLIAAKTGARDDGLEIARYEQILQDEAMPMPVRERANKVVSIIAHLRNTERNPSLPYVVNKIELAAQTKS